MKTIAFTLPENLAERLEKIKKEKNYTRSGIVRKALEYYLEEEISPQILKKYKPLYARVIKDEENMAKKMLPAIRKAFINRKIRNK